MYGLMKLSRNSIALPEQQSICLALGSLWVHLRVIFGAASFAKTFEYLDRINVVVQQGRLRVECVSFSEEPASLLSCRRVEAAPTGEIAGQYLHRKNCGCYRDEALVGLLCASSCGRSSKQRAERWVTFDERTKTRLPQYIGQAKITV